MATGSTNVLCVVCSERTSSSDSRLLGSKGLSTLMEISRKRGDELHEELVSPGDHFVHIKCYKTYTAPKNISKMQKVANSDGGRESPIPILRSSNNPFDYPTHCLICTKELDFEESSRHPERSSSISSIEMVNKEKQSLLQGSLMKACEDRQDVHAINVKARIVFAGDLRAVEAKYHRVCMQSFLSEKNISHSGGVLEANVRNLNSLNDDAFSHLCGWLAKSEQKQHTLTDLRAQLSTYLPKDVPAYSTRHIKRRLIEYFGKQLTITEVEGRPSVITLRDTAATILHETYVASAMEIDDEEDIRLAKQVGSQIKQELVNIDQPSDVYPSPKYIDLNSLHSCIPLVLQNLTKPFSLNHRLNQQN